MYLPKLTRGEINLWGFLFSFIDDFFFDILLIEQSYSTPTGNTWYLSALFIVFPIFCLFIQIRNRYYTTIISLLYILLYYGIAGVNGCYVSLGALPRVLAALCIGTFVYEITVIFNDYFLSANKVTLTFIELCFLFYQLLCYTKISFLQDLLFYVLQYASQLCFRAIHIPRNYKGILLLILEN